MAQKPITAQSEFTIDRHDERTDALSIDGVFVGYVSKSVSQLLRVLCADIVDLRGTVAGIKHVLGMKPDESAPVNWCEHLADELHELRRSSTAHEATRKALQECFRLYDSIVSEREYRQRNDMCDAPENQRRSRESEHKDIERLLMAVASLRLFAASPAAAQAVTTQEG